MGEIGLQRRDQKIVQVVIFFLAECVFSCRVCLFHAEVAEVQSL